MGRVIYLNDTPIGWNSKGQGSVTLSLTKAEYFSMSKGMKDLKYVQICLMYIKMKVTVLPPCWIHWWWGFVSNGFYFSEIEEGGNGRGVDQECK